jgi:hypothetical protein
VKAHRAAVEDLLGHEGRRALNLAAEADFRVFFRARDPRLRPECRLASTSCELLPIEETIPIPVTTTRLIRLSLGDLP